MATRAEVLQGLQVGKESTAGTAVAASKIFRVLRPTGPAVVRPVEEVVATGGLAPVASVIGKGHSVAQLEGRFAFGDALWLLGTHFKQPATTGSSTYTHVFTPAFGAANVIDTLTVEVGDGTNAEKMAYAFCPEFRIGADMLRTTLQATLMGRPQTEGVTITASPTEVLNIIGGCNEWDFADAAESGSPSWTAMRALALEFTSSGRWGPLFTSEASQDSFTDLTEMAPEISMNVTVEHTANARTLIGYKTTQATRMARFRIVSATSPHSLEIQMCYRITGNVTPVTEQGVKCVRVPLKCFYGSTAAFFCKTTLINTISAL